jgi:hypothetical protein
VPNSTLLTYHMSLERAGYLKRRVKPCVMRRLVFKALKGRNHISPFQGYSLIHSSRRQGFTLPCYIPPFQGFVSEVNKTELIPDVFSLKTVCFEGSQRYDQVLSHFLNFPHQVVGITSMGASIFSSGSSIIFIRLVATCPFTLF